MKKIAIFGGTFNPIHNGHISVALNFLDALSLDQIFFVPTNISPHKIGLGVVDPVMRFQMCKIALQRHLRFRVSDIELLRRGVSFSYQTLQTFQDMFPYDEIYFIIGADMFMTVESWMKPEKIFEISTVCTVPRDNYDFDLLKAHAKKLKTLGAKVFILSKAVSEVSSSFIREKVLNHEDISSFVPRGVENFILKNNLYVG